MIVTIVNGQADVKRGFIRPEDRKEAAKVAGGADKIKGGKTAKAAKKPGELSFAAVQRLQAEATAALQVSIADDPDFALVLLVSELAYTALRSTYDGESRRWVHICREHSGRVSGPHREAAKATKDAKAMEAAATKWRKELPTTLPKIREWALEQEKTNPQKLKNLLAFLVARETECVDGSPNRGQGVTVLASMADISLSDLWVPTAGAPR